MSIELRLREAARLAAAQVHLDDRGRPAFADAHDDALAVRGEARREGHAGEVADQLALARLQVHEEHAGLVAVYCMKVISCAVGRSAG